MPCIDPRYLNVKQEVQYVAIFNDILFTFSAHFARFFSTCFTFECDVIFKCDGLCTDESTLKIRVDDTSRLRCSITDVDGPSAHFFDACCEVGLQTQQFEGSADQTVEAWFFHAHIGQEVGLISIIQISDFRLNGGADRNDRCVLCSSKRGQLVKQWVIGKARVRDVRNVQGWFGSDQAQRLDQCHFFCVQTQCADWLGIVQCWHDTF